MISAPHSERPIREQLHQQVLCAREQERKQIARDLHDEVIQSLVGLNYEIAALEAGPPHEHAARLCEIQQHVRQVIDEVRRICIDLRPPTLDSLGLLAAVRARLREWERQTGQAVTLSVEGDADQPIAEPAAICAYRVLQEGLSNVHRHARASQVSVTMQLAPALLSMTICDDGCGFDVPENLDDLLAGQHLGLIGIRERMEMVDGVFHVWSEPGYGTCLRIELRLHAAVLERAT